MIKKISVMGLDLDNYSFPEAISIIESFLKDTALSTVLSVNMQKLLSAGEDPVVREVISNTSYTVITDKAILEAVPDSGAERVLEVETTDFFYCFLNHMYRADRTFYLVGASGEVLDRFEARLRNAFPYIRIAGRSVICSDPHINENAVNDINILMPDVILSVLGTPDEEHFLRTYQTQLCARVWYGAGAQSADSREKFSIKKQLQRARDKISFRARIGSR